MHEPYPPADPGASKKEPAESHGVEEEVPAYTTWGLPETLSLGACLPTSRQVLAQGGQGALRGAATAMGLAGLLVAILVPNLRYCRSAPVPGSGTWIFLGLTALGAQLLVMVLVHEGLRRGRCPEVGRVVGDLLRRVPAVLGVLLLLAGLRGVAAGALALAPLDALPPLARAGLAFTGALLGYRLGAFAVHEAVLAGAGPVEAVAGSFRLSGSSLRPLLEGIVLTVAGTAWVGGALALGAFVCGAAVVAFPPLLALGLPVAASVICLGPAALAGAWTLVYLREKGARP